MARTSRHQMSLRIDEHREYVREQALRRSSKGISAAQWFYSTSFNGRVLFPPKEYTEKEQAELNEMWGSGGVHE